VLVTASSHRARRDSTRLDRRVSGGVNWLDEGRAEQFVRTSVVVSADETGSRMTFGQTNEALVAAVERTAWKPSTTVRRLAGRRLGPAAAAAAAVASSLLPTRLVLAHLRVIRVVVAVVAQSRPRLRRRRRFLRLADFPRASCRTRPTYTQPSGQSASTESRSHRRGADYLFNVTHLTASAVGQSERCWTACGEISMSSSSKQFLPVGDLDSI